MRIQEVLAAKQEIVAVVVLLPETPLLRQGADSDLDDGARELIDLGMKVPLGSGGVLIVRVPRFVAPLSIELGYPHPIVVDQTEISVRSHHDVAVL